MAYTMNDGLIAFDPDEYHKLSTEDWKDIMIDGEPISWDIYDRLSATEAWSFDGDTAIARPTRFISVDGGLSWENASEFFAGHNVTDKLWDDIWSRMDLKYRQGNPPADPMLRCEYLAMYLATADDDLEVVDD